MVTVTTVDGRVISVSDERFLSVQKTPANRFMRFLVFFPFPFLLREVGNGKIGCFPMRNSQWENCGKNSLFYLVNSRSFIEANCAVFFGGFYVSICSALAGTAFFEFFDYRFGGRFIAEIQNYLRDLIPCWAIVFVAESNVSQSKSGTDSNNPLHRVHADRWPRSPSLFLQHVQTIRPSVTSSLAACITKTHRGTDPRT